MHTERRHELETNTLAKGLTDWGDKLRPYTNLILLAIAALVGVYIAASMWNSYRATRDRAAWDDYQMALFEGDGEQRTLQRLASSEDHEGTGMQEWALVGWADRQLLRASQMYLNNRDESQKRLDRVIEVYGEFAENGSGPEIRNRSRLGLARAYEMRNDLEKARAEYARVEGALAEVAAERLKQLESKPAQDAIGWLATADLPKPAAPSGPGVPGDRPGFEAAPPAAEKAGDMKFDTTKSLEEILGGVDPSTDASRYGEGAAPAASVKTESTESAPKETPSEPAAAKESNAPSSPSASETPADESAPSEPAETAPAPQPPAAESSQPAEPPASEAAAPAAK
jgi:hypothetical protein